MHSLLAMLMNREVVIRKLDSESAHVRQKNAALLAHGGERSTELIIGDLVVKPP
jgi:hypothetical protein